MRMRSWVMGAAVGFAACTAFAGGTGLTLPAEPPLEWVPGDLIIGFEAQPTDQDVALVNAVAGDAASWRSMLHAPHAKGNPAAPHPLSMVRIINVGPEVDVHALAERVAALPGVRYAEPNYITHIALHPNDPRYDSFQYGPQIINAEAAWDITLGSMSTVLCVADTGIHYNHEDLVGSLWVNDDPINGVDDDGNGFVDDLNGWDFYNNDNNMQDGNGHGTHVSGIAAARTNNNLGIAGMAKVSIMFCQVFSAGGGGTWEAIANAVFYATDNGAVALNYSGGGNGGSSLLQQGVEYAYDNGMPVVAAAGNFGSQTPFYPAAYPEVIAVAGTDSNDNRYGSSNFGNWIDVAAPAVNVYSCLLGGNNSYGNLTGTSMASPHVAGLVALMYTVDPSLTPLEVTNFLRDNAVDLGNPGFDTFFGYGRIDAGATLEAVQGGGGGCNGALTVTAICTVNGRVIAYVRNLSPGTNVTFTLDGANSQSDAANARGTALVSWTNAGGGAHVVEANAGSDCGTTSTNCP